MFQSNIFISYSRRDRALVMRLAEHLRQVYGDSCVWLDDELVGGQVWWEEILSQIERCCVVVYAVSPASLASPYCQAERAEAARLHKPILPVIIRPRTELPPELSRIQYINMAHGLTVEGITALSAALINCFNAPSPPRPVSDVPTPLPADPGPRSVLARLFFHYPRTLNALLAVAVVLIALVLARSQGLTPDGTAPTPGAVDVPVAAEPATATPIPPTETRIPTAPPTDPGVPPAAGCRLALAQARSVRSGPGTNYASLGVAARGQAYTVIGRTMRGVEPWYEIEIGALSGWVWAGGGVPDAPIAQVEGVGCDSLPDTYRP